jgi:hypothetical protein
MVIFLKMIVSIFILCLAYKNNNLTLKWVEYNKKPWVPSITFIKKHFQKIKNK